MLIRCPECGHTRQVNDETVPPKSTAAICPKCKVRFQFRTLPEEQARDLKNGSGPGRAAPGSRDDEDLWSAVEKFRGLGSDDERKPGRKDDGGQPFQRFDEGGGDRRPEDGNGSKWQDQQNCRVDEKTFLANKGSVPWEYKGGFLNPLVFLRTLLLSVTRAADFFSGLPLAGSLVPALIFAAVLRGIQFLASYAIFKFDVVVPATGEAARMSLAEIAGIPLAHVFVAALFIIVLAQFVSSLIVNLMVHVVNPGKSRFPLTFRVVAYSLSPLVLVLVPQVGMFAGEIGSLALFVIGLRHAYKMSWGRTMMVVLPLVILTTLVSAGMLQSLTGGAWQ